MDCGTREAVQLMRRVRLPLLAGAGCDDGDGESRMNR